MRFDNISSDTYAFYFVISSQSMYMTFSMLVNATFPVVAMVIRMDATIPETIQSLHIVLIRRGTLYKPT